MVRRFLILLALAPLPIRAQDPVPASASGIAARVNREIVTWDEVELRIKVPDAETRERMRLPMLRKVAEEKLFQQEAKEYKVVITDTMIDDSLKQDRKQFRSDDEFLRFVNRTLNMTLSEFREERRTMLLINHLVQKMIFDSVRNPNLNSMLLLEFVSPEELRTYYDGHRDEFKALLEADVIRLYWFFTDDAERAEKVKLAESVCRRLAQGADPVTLAVFYMDLKSLPKDPDGKPKFRYRNLGPSNSPFGEEANRQIFKVLQPGSVSPVIVERNTVNLFYLHERIDQKEDTFETAQPKIRRRLENEKHTLNRRMLRDELLKRSFIEPSDLFK